MFTRIIQLLQKNRLKKVLFLSLCFTLLSAYPIYKNYINGEGNTTYQRITDIFEGKSEFYNPWQYRILCPLIIRGTKYVIDNTLGRVFSTRKVEFQFKETSKPTADTREFISNIQRPEFLELLMIFLIFRFIEDLVVFILSYLLLAFFIKNNWLIFLALILISWSMGNSVNASDLTFNTYLDIILYLLSGCIILYKKNPWYILPISIIGAFNRETSLMIPFLYFVSSIDFSKAAFSMSGLRAIMKVSSKVYLISILSFISFCTVSIAIRVYFGYRPQTVWKVPAGWAMLRLNLLSLVAVKCYFEMIGAFSIIPLICIYKFKICDYILKVWFIAIVPIWFFVHLYSVVAYESRLFLVPTLLIFLPMTLQIIEKSFSVPMNIKTSSARAA